MSTRTFRRVVEAARKRKTNRAFVADMLSDAADIIDRLRAVHAASLRRVRWIRVGDYSVAHVGNKVAVICWGANGACEVFLLPAGCDVQRSALLPRYRIGFASGYTPEKSAARLLRKAR